jgi:putative membrane protein
MKTGCYGRQDFWHEVLELKGSVTPYVAGRVLWAGLWCLTIWTITKATGSSVDVGVAPYEIIGVVLALLLVMRTNSGYDRWYEGRKLWGGIVNQSRNLGVIATAYGASDPEWQARMIRWTAAFPHLARLSLRGDRDLSELRNLLNADEIGRLQPVNYRPLHASLEVGRLLQEGIDNGTLDRFAFVRAEEQRSLLVDYLGSCERIMKTPLAKVFSIKIRHFLFLYLLVLPLALIDRCGLLSALVTMLVAYPLLSLDQIGVELENPFSKERLSHLPLDDIGNGIQRDVQSLIEPDDVSSSAVAIRRTRINGAALQTSGVR